MKTTAFAATAGFAAALAFASPALAVSETFGVGFDFDDGPGSLNFTLSGLDTNISSDLTIDFTVIGDLSNSTEFFDLSIDGVDLGRGCDNSTGNDSFGFASDECSEFDDTFQTASATIAQTTAANLLADGELIVTFDFSSSVDDFVDITTAQTFSGAVFGVATNLSFAVGGTVSYDTAPPAVPLPAGMPLLLVGLAAFGVARRAKRAG